MIKSGFTQSHRRAELILHPQTSNLDNALVTKTELSKQSNITNISEFRKQDVQDMVPGVNGVNESDAPSTSKQSNAMGEANQQQEEHASEEKPTTVAIKSGRWSEQEHKLFLEGLKTHGKNWKVISEMVQTRSPVQIRTHAQKYFLRQARNLSLSGKITEDVVENVLRESPALGAYSGDSEFTIEGTRVCLPISALRASQKMVNRQTSSPTTMPDNSHKFVPVRLGELGRRHSTAVLPSRSLREETVENPNIPSLHRSSSYHGDTHPALLNESTMHHGHPHALQNRRVPIIKFEDSVPRSAPSSNHGLGDSRYVYTPSNRNIRHSSVSHVHQGAGRELWSTPEHPTNTGTAAIGKSIRAASEARGETEDSPSCFTPPKTETPYLSSENPNRPFFDEFATGAMEGGGFRPSSLPHDNVGQQAYGRVPRPQHHGIVPHSLGAPHSLPHHVSRGGWGTPVSQQHSNPLQHRRKSMVAPSSHMPHHREARSHFVRDQDMRASKSYTQPHHSFTVQPESNAFSVGGDMQSLARYPSQTPARPSFGNYDIPEVSDAFEHYENEPKAASTPGMDFAAMESEDEDATRMRVDSAYQFELEPSNVDEEMDEDFLSF